MDIMDGIVVSGKGGERDKYKPLKSVICNSCNPIDVAKAYKNLGAKKVYIADLNAILGNGNNLDIIKKIDFLYKIVDFGIRDRKDYEKVREFFTPIIATETVKDISLFKEKDIFISLDFKNGKLLNYNLEDIINIINKNVPLIVLDISSVGSQRGVNIDLVNKIINIVNNPVYVGGGVKGEEDIKTLEDLGVTGVLVGTAIHKGIIKI